MANRLEAAKVLLTVCTDCKQDENILFVTDDTSEEIAKVMWEAAKDFKNKSIVKMTDRVMHGDEPPKIVAEAMFNADVIFGVTKFSMFHTDARRNAVKNGARYANMVDYTIEMMEEGGLYVDFLEQGRVCDNLYKVMGGDVARVTSALGTDITCKITGREPLKQYGRSIVPGASSSPPDVECAVAPLEDTANGVVIIDGSIPHPQLGLINQNIKLTLENGKIVKIEPAGDAAPGQAEILADVLKNLNDPAVYSLAEIGIGLNNLSKLNGRMLEDEGAMGTVHFGFGGNASFGGIIVSNNHLDMVFRNPTIEIDGNIIMKDGVAAF